MSLVDRRDARTLEELHALLPAERIATGAADRLIYARDMWPKALFALRGPNPALQAPDVVVWPESTEELSAIVRLAGRHAVPLIPYGGGSGVCGGAMATGGGIVVDLKRMKRVLEICGEDHVATFEAGINGQVLEDQLNLRGLTLGHFPASIFCSTLGGWLATRSAGQLSSKYGKIEDMVQSLQVVLGDGRVVECATSDEPSTVPLFVGSEGTLGIITRATLAVKPLAGYRAFRAYAFPRLAAGCEAMRRVLQRGLRPAVMRLYDEADSLFARRERQGPKAAGIARGAAARGPLAMLRERAHAHLHRALLRSALSRAGLLSRLAEGVLPRLHGGCLAILGFEGEPARTQVEAALGHAEYLAAGAKDLGEELGRAWHENRYAVSYKMSPIYASGGFGDTMEVATTWDNLLTLYREVRQALVPLALVLAHFSHAYPEGCSIYFTMAAGAEGQQADEALYERIWRDGLAAATRAGGTISHHHGVGQSKAAFMAAELGGGLERYRQLKAVFDPRGILNPGKMGL